MANGESESEPEHDPSLLRAAVALPGELFDEVVAPSHTDVPQGQSGKAGRTSVRMFRS